MIDILILLPGILSVAVLGAQAYRCWLRRKLYRRFEQVCDAGDDSSSAWAIWKIRGEL